MAFPNLSIFTRPFSKTISWTSWVISSFTADIRVQDMVHSCCLFYDICIYLPMVHSFVRLEKSPYEFFSLFFLANKRIVSLTMLVFKQLGLKKGMRLVRFQRVHKDSSVDRKGSSKMYSTKYADHYGKFFCNSDSIDASNTTYTHS